MQFCGEQEVGCVVHKPSVQVAVVSEVEYPVLQTTVQLFPDSVFSQAVLVVSMFVVGGSFAHFEGSHEPSLHSVLPRGFVQRALPLGVKPLLQPNEQYSKYCFPTQFALPMFVM